MISKQNRLKPIHANYFAKSLISKNMKGESEQTDDEKMINCQPGLLQNVLRI